MNSVYMIERLGAEHRRQLLCEAEQARDARKAGYAPQVPSRRAFAALAAVVADILVRLNR